jgi:threonine synthase
MKSMDEKVVFSVPSGNFGDLMAGLIAKRMGLPVSRFIAAVNENDEFPVFLETGKYSPVVPSKPCLSNAMNVGHPSNLARVIDMYNGFMDNTGKIHEMPDMEKLKSDIVSLSVSDKETIETIKQTYDKHKVILEPHGAVGWFAFENLKDKLDFDFSVTFETADPAKFPEELNKLGIEPELPASMKDLDKKKEEFEKLTTDYDKFKQFLVEKF